MLGKGDIVGARYRLGKPLGEGGAAQVFEARDLTLDRKVAVKLLFSDERDKEELAAQFLREAKISAAVQHQHVISIVDFGTTEDNTPYMVMELLEGLSLADRLERDAVLSPMEAVELGALVLRGLGAVHRAAIVHRDLKPENIFLVEDGDGYLPKILDFGISRSVDPASGRESAHSTQDGLLVGTPDYMSPEQVRGLSDIDTRTDIYSIGVILYEVVTGRMPFESENVGDLMIMIAAGNAPTAAEVAPWVPEALSKVIERAMSRQRDMRYQTTREMLEALIEVGYQLDLSKDVEVTGPFKVLKSTIPPAPRTPEDIHAVAESVNRYHEEAKRLASSAPPTATPMHKSPMAMVLIGAVAVLLGLGIAGAVVLSSSDGRASETPTTTAAPPPPQTEPAISDEVVLENLPEDATVRLDDAITSHPITLVRDNAPHVIEVTQTGHEPWRVTHVAAGPAEYEVELVAIAQEAEEPTAEELAEAETEEEPSMGSRRRRRRRGEMSEMSEMAATEMTAEAEGGMHDFRTLDY